MKIEQFKYAADNLGYLVYSKQEGLVIDGGAVDDIITFTQKNQIHIKYITNTHAHYDHTPGNEVLLKKTSARFVDCGQIKSDQILHLDEEDLEIFYTPGHTDDSITFKADNFIVTGDTLFNGTVGNCFSGDFKGFFRSLKRLISLPEATRVYGGHDYVIESMKMAKIIEKDNPYIKEYLKKYNPGLIVSTLADELKANPYVRFNAQSMIENLQKRNLPISSEFDRFNSIMEIY